MPFDLPFDYVLAMVAWLAALAVSLRLLVIVRRRGRKLRPTGKVAGSNRRGGFQRANLALSVWVFLAALTAVELYFAVIYDASDALNVTNVSKHWFQRHVKPVQKILKFHDGLITIYRDEHEFRKTLVDGQRQICFVGDSFTFGHGVAHVADRFSDRIGASFERQAPGRFVVSNLADAGRDLHWIEVLLTYIVADRLPVNIVVYVVCLNDIETFDKRTMTWFAQLGNERRHCFLLDDTYFLNLLYCRTMLARPGREREYYALLQDAYHSPAWDRMSNKLDNVHRLCDENGIDLRIVIFPFLHELGPGYAFADAHRLIAEYCDARQVPVLDLLPVLEPHAGEGLTVSRFDSHPNERAHALAAEAIERGLLGDLLVKSVKGPN